jgi:hypothetical protein
MIDIVRFIAESCKSIYFFPFVCTLVDDASTDGEQEVIRHYINENFDLQETIGSYKKDKDYGHVTFARHKSNVNCYFAIVYFLLERMEDLFRPELMR